MLSRTRAQSRWWQLGQSMAEYLVVMAALVGGLLVANRGACPDHYEDCIEYLLTVMHDNYDGYSASISAVHEYADDYEVAEAPASSDGDGSDDGGDGGGSAGGGGSTEPEAAISQSTILTSNGGFTNLGEYDPSTGLVTQNGEVVGSYDSDTGVFEAVDGGTTTNVEQVDVITDEDGNILQREAVSDCGDPPGIYGFGYESQANGNFYDSLQFNEMDIDGFCTETAYKVRDRQGNEDGGRIVDGYYYAVSTTPDSFLSTGVKEPDGEVVFFDLGGGVTHCAVMAAGWDSGIDTDDLSDEEIYAEQLALLLEPDEEETTVIGSMDAEHYTEQVYINGEPAASNDCVSNRVITAP
ncbi:hypothetical protein [Gilvimarinus algae]|uniref:Uncharacterized protein n=1 Tax=Gilvimarinus algae TaxID=3058037 RepID=A0ABT8TEF3_9GAMM|nr:hypothetical protein [Gilvimarinus sp. SDUM040014]MDO3380682.1 hypothetical protein [Gilvimarinus sp. SDUM040014]